MNNQWGEGTPCRSLQEPLYNQWGEGTPCRSLQEPLYNQWGGGGGGVLPEDKIINYIGSEHYDLIPPRDKRRSP